MNIEETNNTKSFALTFHQFETNTFENSHLRVLWFEIGMTTRYCFLSDHFHISIKTQVISYEPVCAPFKTSPEIECALLYILSEKIRDDVYLCKKALRRFHSRSSSFCDRMVFFGDQSVSSRVRRFHSFLTCCLLNPGYSRCHRTSFTQVWCHVAGWRTSFHHVHWTSIIP